MAEEVDEVGGVPGVDVAVKVDGEVLEEAMEVEEDEGEDELEGTVAVKVEEVEDSPGVTVADEVGEAMAVEEDDDGEELEGIVAVETEEVGDAPGVTVAVEVGGDVPGEVLAVKEEEVGVAVAVGRDETCEHDQDNARLNFEVARIGRSRGWSQASLSISSPGKGGEADAALLDDWG